MVSRCNEPGTAPRVHGPPASFYLGNNGQLVLTCSVCGLEVSA